MPFVSVLFMFGMRVIYYLPLLSFFILIVWLRTSWASIPSAHLRYTSDGTQYMKAIVTVIA
jgi:hypothetical protein